MYQKETSNSNHKRKINLVVFDFDGTLADTRNNIVTTLQMTIKEMALPSRSDDECASTIGLPLVYCFKKLFPELTDEQTKLCAETYKKIFNQNLESIKPQAFPQVKETIKTLKDKGATITIASSRNHISLVELTHYLGIDIYISLMLGADDVVNAKPDAEPVTKTLETLHKKAEETLVVGDMAVDITMGKSAGTKTCGVTWGNGKEEELREVGADFIISTMEELTRIVDQL